MNQRREAILNHPALLPVAGNYDRKPRSLDRDVTSIGRARGSDLCLEANEISTLHCLIYRTLEGYRIRDCNSRTGTRVNGESVKNHALHDGDIINLGPFSFELRIPPALFPRDHLKFDPVKVMHWQESRRKLALQALKLRERLHLTRHGSTKREEELLQKAHLLKEKIRSYDHRSSELEGAERELTEEREKLAQEKEAHEKHVQQVENSLAHRLEQAEEEIHQRWQEFQQRCNLEEARLQQLSLAVPADPAGPAGPALGPVPLEPGRQQEFMQLQHDLQEQQERFLDIEKRLTQQQHQLDCERQEFLTMKDQWVKDQLNSAASVEDQKAALAQQEASLRSQKAELMRMMGDLKKMQEDLRKQSKGDLRGLQLENERLQHEQLELRAQLKNIEDLPEVQTIRAENEQLRQLVQELEQHAGQPVVSAATDKQLADLRTEVDLLHEELHRKEAQLKQAHRDPDSDLAAIDEEMQRLQGENILLKNHLQEKELLVEQLNKKSQQRPTTEGDLERYETELNEYRRQLDQDRAKLTNEVELLRERNKELDEAVREMEMEMSKERAELGRERIRLERVRDEIKGDMERLQREIAVRDSMAPVQKLRDEITGKQPPANGKADKALNDRLRSFRNQLTDSSS